jgi:nucleoside-diphosphate-sugar epimerase
MTSNSKSPTIAITGANGFLGKTLVAYFSNKGWKVVALVRQTPEAQQRNVKYKEYDLSSQLDPKVLNDIDYLVHTAYVKQDRQHPDAYKTNVKAAKNIVIALEKQKFKKCLFVSSMSAHDEAISAYGKQKLAIEKIFNGPNFVSIRSGLIIGNGGLVKQMVEFMRSKHVVPLVEGGKQPLQIVSVDDLAVVIDKVLQSQLSGVLTIATPEVYSYKKLYEAISKKLKIKVLFVPIPFFLLINLIRLVNLLPIPIAVNTDNALGLKQLRSAETAYDLKKIGIKLKNLEESLANIDT